MGNTIGELFRLTTFGESHGVAIGGVLDGVPAGLAIDEEYVQHELDRRRPGQSALTTQRNESDTVEWLSGVFEGKTTGTPLAFVLKNKDARSKDYGHLKDVYRPSHADFTYEKKYGLRDYRGGGRQSARETAVRVAAGAVAQLLLKELGVEVVSYVHSVADIAMDCAPDKVTKEAVDNSLVRCPDAKTTEKMVQCIEAMRDEGDSVGGVIKGCATGVPVGLGQPVFDKLHADLGKALLSINAVKGVSFGAGFDAAKMRGSQHNDAFFADGEEVKTRTNRSGGIQGGISNGSDIEFQVAFKPTATIQRSQETVNTVGEDVKLAAKGRHDPCVLPRAVPIVDAMVALVLVDHYLRSRTDRMEHLI